MKKILFALLSKLGIFKSLSCCAKNQCPTATDVEEPAPTKKEKPAFQPKKAPAKTTRKKPH